jgi:Na+/proline symporter
MHDWLGLKPIDLAVVIGYFVVVMAVGFWVSRRVKNETDYFLGGRRFGKGLLVMHWLCTGTHSDSAVQVAGATARVGLGGIWWQWMWMFSTPFYWFIGPIMRRLRVLTTGDVFRLRYGRGMEVLYAFVALVYIVLSIASLLRGAGAAIAGTTGGQVPTQASVIVLSVLFSSYIMAGGLIAAAYTDVLQGLLIIVLSVLLIPAGLALVGGAAGLHDTLGPERFGITAPPDREEGHLWFVVAMSLLGLTGIVAQPHVMTATGSGKTELEARVGMTYGNFIKRLLTIAWAFTGLIALAYFPNFIEGVPKAQHTDVSEQLYGRAVREFLGDGWRGLMVACLIAGVTSAETVMVVGSGLFTRNFYVHLRPSQDQRRLLWVGRIASAGILAASIAIALVADSVKTLFNASVDIIALLGPAFWLGVTWRRANTAGVVASFLVGLAVWAVLSLPLPVLPARTSVVEPDVADVEAKSPPAWQRWLEKVPGGDHAVAAVARAQGWGKPWQIALRLLVEFALLVVVSLLTPRPSAARLDPFFARLLTPVGKEDQVRAACTEGWHPDAALGIESCPLDYQQARSFGYSWPRALGLELPRFGWLDWLGFLAAWLLVAALIGLLVLLAGWGATGVGEQLRPGPQAVVWP